MNRHRDRFSEAGLPLRVIGQGTPQHAAAFRQDHGLELDLLVDTERQAYRAAGTKVGSVRDLLSPRVVARGVRSALRSGVIQGRVVGHAAQLGGLVLVMPDGTIPWAHLSDDASDYPPVDELLAAVRGAAEEAARPT